MAHPDPNTASAPSLIGNRWHVQRVLGEGGMGLVLQCWSADDPNRPVAIKILTSDHPNAQDRFRREAELLMRIEHPNVVRALHADMGAAQPFIVMELAEGQPLSELLAARGALSPAVALGYLAQLTEALAYLHGLGVAHRDLKPSNVIVGEGTLKLIDFGIAKPDGRTQITTGGTAVGTVAYAPPEWLWPKRVDPARWDVYALGVLLYEMLTGHQPFGLDPDLPNLEAAMHVMRRKRTQLHLTLDDSYPASLVRIVAWTTANVASMRPSAADLLPTLDAALRLKSLQKEPARIRRPAQPPAMPTWVLDNGDAPSLAASSVRFTGRFPRLRGPRALWIPIGLACAATAAWLIWTLL